MTPSPIERTSTSGHTDPSQNLVKSSPQILNRVSAEQLVNDLSFVNWPTAYSELCSKQPNLARVVSAIDQLLPHETGEEQVVLGYTIGVPEALRGHRKPNYSTSIVRQRLQPHTQQALQQPGQSFTRSSLAFIQRLPWIGSRHNTEQKAAEPSTAEESSLNEVENVSQALSDHHENLIRLLLKKTLTDIPNLELKTQENNMQKADISADAAERILQQLLGTRPANTSTNTELIHKQLLEKHPASSTKTTMSHSFRRDAITKCPALADFYTAVGAALQIQIKDPNATLRFNVPEDQDLNDIEMERRKTEQGMVLYDTFCPGVSRPAMDLDDLENCAFIIKKDGTEIPLEDAALVINYVFDDAKAHLLAQSKSEEPAENQRYPLMVYKTLAKALNLPVPKNLLEHEARLHQQVVINQKVTDQKALANKKRIADIQAVAAQKKLEKEIRNQEYCSQYSISHINNLSLATISAPPNSASNTTEYSKILRYMGDGPALFRRIKDTLDSSRNHQEVASNTRSIQALQNPTLLHKDNRCWLRALWISVFSQIQNVAQIEAALEKMSIKQKPYKQHWPVLFNAVLDDFKNRPNELLHRGERGGLRADAHFMNGLSVGEYLESKGIPTELYHKKDFSFTVEKELFNAAVGLAMGMRGEEKPKFDNNVANTKVPGVLMNSEFLVAVHRVMDLPCLVVERSLSGQVSVIYSGPATDPDLREISDKLGMGVNEDPIRLEDLQPLFEKYKNIPVLMLNAEHYTVYLPQAQNQHLLTPAPSPQPTSPAQLPPPLPASHTPVSHPTLPTIQHTPPEVPRHFRENPQSAEPTQLSRTESAESVDLLIDMAETQASSEVKTILDGTEQSLKANRIDFGHAGFAVVGQTPESEHQSLLNLSNLLEEGSTNEFATLFEYISPAAKVTPQLSKHPGTLAWLKTMIHEKSQEGKVLEINGKHITGLIKGDSYGDPGWIDRYRIEYRDNNAPNQPRYIYITQAAPDFSRKFLTAEQLLQSFQALQGSEFIVGDNRFLLSARGVGRSAALAVLDKAHVAMRQRILTHPDQIDAWLHHAKACGVRDRGEYFLAKREQVEELHKAISMLLADSAGQS